MRTLGMIVILDTEKGRALNFRYRKEGALFLDVSQPTLRKWLKEPFYLHKTFIITSTGNGKIEESQKILEYALKYRIR